MMFDYYLARDGTIIDLRTCAAVNLRQSGRTTRMLQEANEAKKRGERVLVMAPNTHIQDQLVMTARKMGFLTGSGPTGELDRRKDFAVVREVVEGRRRGFSGIVFDDHTVGEMISTKDSPRYNQEVAMMTLLSTPPVPVPEDDADRWVWQPF